MKSDNKVAVSERCYRFSVRLVKFIKKLPEKRVYWTISDQLLRAGTSIAANIIEGKGASSRKDFINYYQIALKSANETVYWMNLLKDGLDLNDVELEGLRQEGEELPRIIAACVVSLKIIKK